MREREEDEWEEDEGRRWETTALPHIMQHCHNTMLLPWLATPLTLRLEVEARHLSQRREVMPHQPRLHERRYTAQVHHTGSGATPLGRHGNNRLGKTHKSPRCPHDIHRVASHTPPGCGGTPQGCGGTQEHQGCGSTQAGQVVYKQPPHREPALTTGTVLALSFPPSSSSSSSSSPSSSSSSSSSSSPSSFAAESPSLMILATTTRGDQPRSQVSSRTRQAPQSTCTCAGRPEAWSSPSSSCCTAPSWRACPSATGWPCSTSFRARRVAQWRRLGRLTFRRPLQVYDAGEHFTMSPEGGRWRVLVSARRRLRAEDPRQCVVTKRIEGLPYFS